MGPRYKKIVLGSAQWGLSYGVSNKKGKTNFNEVKKILSFAEKLGICMVDTAPVYGDCEMTLGKAGIRNFEIVTKILISKTDTYSPGTLLKSFLKSKTSLKKRSIYGLLLHQPDLLFDNGGEAFYSQMLELKADKLVKKIGASVYTLEQAQRCLEKQHFDLIQIPFSLLDRRFESSGLARELKQAKVEIHGRSIFLQGLLLMEPDQIPKELSQFVKPVSLIRSNAYDLGITPAQYLVKFAYEADFIDKLVIGVENCNQLKHLSEMISDQRKIEWPEFQISDEQLLMPMNWKL